MATRSYNFVGDPGPQQPNVSYTIPLEPSSYSQAPQPPPPEYRPVFWSTNGLDFQRLVNSLFFKIKIAQLVLAFIIIIVLGVSWHHCGIGWVILVHLFMTIYFIYTTLTIFGYARIQQPFSRDTVMLFVIASCVLFITLFTFGCVLTDCWSLIAGIFVFVLGFSHLGEAIHNYKMNFDIIEQTDFEFVPAQPSTYNPAYEDPYYTSRQQPSVQSGANSTPQIGVVFCSIQ